ncbi:FGGY family carbohydrate kinase [Kaistia terrae]|uniref:FGGY family carbohydrate kinase n=1 Tax=Kaistia terrae TaxID=537017 RepID=A0ABW0PXU5_9HYPH|nr:FGGY family carbohydrate kinase [Kaistia terrae]MCX5579432.1 FGGY family carbohydrate kinase [Kaistia terrae]
MLVDDALRPLGPAIPWFDLRAHAEAEELAANFACTDRTGIEFEPTRTAAKWLWLARHEPAAIQSAHAWIALTDYPATVWAQSPFMSRSLAVRTACYDIGARKWIPALLQATGAPRLPVVVPAGATIGTLVKGPLTRSGAATTATRLVAGGHDHPVAASVSLRVDPTAIVDSLGTAELIYAETAGPVAPRPGIVRSVPIVGDGEALLKVFELTATLAPLKSLLGGLLALPRIPGAPDPAAVILPGGIGKDVLAARLDTADAEGRLVLARRVLEGCAVVAGRILNDILASGASDGPLFTTGGWSRSDALLQLRADVLDRTLHRLDEPELAAFGAALIAADGGTRGNGRSLRPAVETIVPDPHAARAYAPLRG